MNGVARLTAIICADAVGFGARAAADEAEAHAALGLAHETLRRLFEAHGGRILKTWGDGVVAEFAAIGEAVRAAIAFQGEHDSRPGALRFRIGINLADVMHEENDLFGHGVNVAARLQQAAPPGGILISEAVHAAVAERLTVEFEPAGRVEGKQNEPPIAAWRLVVGGGSVRAAAAMAGAMPAKPGTDGSTRPQEDVPWWRLRRREKAGLVGIAFLAAINLTTPHHTLWFVYPALAITFLLALGRALGGEDEPRRRRQ